MSSCCGPRHHNKHEEKHEEKAHFDEKKHEQEAKKKSVISKLFG